MRYLKLFEDFEPAEEAQLRALGLGHFDWRAEIEIDFYQAGQNDPEEIEAILRSWLPAINAESPAFQLVEDSIDIDEWQDSDFLKPLDGLPTPDQLADMSTPELLAVIDEFGLEVEPAEADEADEAELLELVQQAVEASIEIDYSSIATLRLVVRSRSASEAAVTEWLETALIGDGRVFSAVLQVEAVA